MGAEPVPGRAQVWGRDQVLSTPNPQARDPMLSVTCHCVALDERLPLLDGTCFPATKQVTGALGEVGIKEAVCIRCQHTSAQVQLCVLLASVSLCARDQSPCFLTPKAFVVLTWTPLGTVF